MAEKNIEGTPVVEKAAGFDEVKFIAEVGGPTLTRQKYVKSRLPKKAEDIDGFLDEFASTDRKRSAWRKELEVLTGKD